MSAPAPDRNEVVALRRCARDIAALSALPAIWITSDFRRGLQNLADVLAAAMRARFVYIRITRPDLPVARVVSTASWRPSTQDTGPIAQELDALLDHRDLSSVLTVPRLGREGPFQLATSPVTAAGGEQGLIVAVSAREDFPRDTDKLLLSTGAAQAAILIQRSHFETEMAARAAELHRTNRALLAAKQRLDATLAAAEIGTWMWDVGQDRMAADPNLARLFGLAETDAQNAPLSVFMRQVHPDDRPALERALEQALATGSDFTAEYRITPDRGETRWVVARGRAELDASGRAVRFPGVLLDITGRKKAENDLRLTRDTAEAANRAKDRFLAVLSHELRTPLSPVLSTVASLEEDRAMPDHLRPAVSMIRRNIELEIRLIDDLLDVSRIASGKLRLQLQPTRVDEVLRHAAETCRDDFAAKNIQVAYALEAPHHLVIGDSARLQQVFWNLLRNAAKFTPAGGKVEVRTSCPHADKLVVEVRDTGIGISEEALARVFLPFEQGETSVTRQFGGLGLGLAICKAVVETHGGSIRVASQGCGHGSTFSVELTTTPAAAALGSAQPPALSIAAPSRNRILLVEDHADTAKSLAWILTKSGYRVTTAHTAASAIEAASQQKFDLIASDLGLPDMDGCELMRKMVQRHALKGIALSGYGMDEDVARARQAGFIAHLVKPVDVTRLRALLKGILAQPENDPLPGAASRADRDAAVAS